MWSFVLVWLGGDNNVTVGFEGLETMENEVLRYRTEMGDRECMGGSLSLLHGKV